MSKLNVFALFHLNIAFSSIEEEQRPEVIARCYWPLLNLPDAINAPIAIEATGYTLECIAAIDPRWIGELRRLIGLGRIEFIGSGYAQLIGPLVPAQVNEANLAIGHPFDPYVDPRSRMCAYSVGETGLSERRDIFTSGIAASERSA